VVDRFVDFPIFRLAQSVSVLGLRQDAYEPMQKMQVLRARIQRERVDAHRTLTETQFDVPAVQQRRELPVATAQVQDDCERVVLLRAGDEEIQEEALSTSCRTQH